jgi:hypothetical protein
VRVEVGDDLNFEAPARRVVADVPVDEVGAKSTPHIMSRLGARRRHQGGIPAIPALVCASMPYGHQILVRAAEQRPARLRYARVEQRAA